ncbi:MAG: helix-turn-helix domain-containing protein [Beijerinckiaceae bacterium]
MSQRHTYTPTTHPVALQTLLQRAPHRIALNWPLLEVDYAWLPPFEGAADTRGNRLEVVFSKHEGVVQQSMGKTFCIDTQPGGVFFVGPSGARLLHVAEYSETLEIYPDAALVQSASAELGIQDFQMESTLQGGHNKLFVRDAFVLARAHLLRRAVLGIDEFSSLQISTLAHELAWHVVQEQTRICVKLKKHALDARRLRQVCEYVEANLGNGLQLSETAASCNLSAWHFARQFKSATGMAPHQYQLARRLEKAKHLLIESEDSVQKIAYSLGFENQHHFRRQFKKHNGLLPSSLRQLVQRLQPPHS